MHKYISKILSKTLACVMCASLLCGTMTSFADNGATANSNDILNGFKIEDNGTNIIITGVTDDVINDGVVVIPDLIDGKPVTQLSSSSDVKSFLFGKPVTKLVLGKNVNSITSYTFYGAKDLAEVDVGENQGFTIDDENKALYTSGDILVKYFSPNEKDDYTVLQGTTKIFNMDNASIGILDLNEVNTLYQLSLAGTEIDTLKIHNEVKTNGNHDILYGALVGEFDVDEASGYDTDGKTLSYGNRLIKLSSGLTEDDVSEDYFNSFTSISPYAFNSLAQYRSLENVIPENLVKDTVFSFYNQDEGVFMVNGEISFCYNYGLMVPTEVGPSTEYSPSIDSEKYDKIKALMYVGVPYDGMGLFEDVFGVSYDTVANDPEEMKHGDVALNIISAMIYDIVDGANPAEIRGVGHGIFTEEAVNEYRSILEDAVENYKDYNFTPSFASTNNITFTPQSDGTYLSNPFTIYTVNGNGDIDDSFVYTINIKNDNVFVSDTNEKSFKTGDEVVLKSDVNPNEVSFTYNEQVLKYYKNTSSGVQNVLTSGVKASEIKIDTILDSEDIVIRKVDMATGEELPGAKLILEKDGMVIDEWISDGSAHVIENPEDGEYKLTEITAPDGYEIAESITFKVEGGRVIGGPVVMKDKPIEEELTTPSEPDEPDEPDKPSTPSTPSEPDKPDKPDKPHVDGGNSGGGGGGHRTPGNDTDNGPGVDKDEEQPELEKNTPNETPIIPSPDNNKSEEHQNPLPKTGDYGAAFVIMISSLITSMIVIKKRKIKVINND